MKIKKDIDLVIMTTAACQAWGVKTKCTNKESHIICICMTKIRHPFKINFGKFGLSFLSSEPRFG